MVLYIRVELQMVGKGIALGGLPQEQTNLFIY